MWVDHIHMSVIIPPKYSVPQVVGVQQGEERDICGAEIRREEEIFQRAAHVGEGIFRFDGRA